jgi:hypothetical protein
MEQENPGAQAAAGTGGAAGRHPQPRTLSDTHDLVYCRCGHPMHPEHMEERHGMKMERYHCPQRRWWNGWMHPHAWMAAREGVPS